MASVTLPGPRAVRGLVLAAAAAFSAACGEPGTGPGRPGAVATVDISPPGGVVAAGETLKLAAVPRDAAGRALQGLAVSWSSSDTLVAAVAGDGTVRTRTSGSTTVTATVGTVAASAVVKVPGLRVVLAPPRADTVGAVPGQALVVEARGADGEPAKGAVIRFESVTSPASPGCIPPVSRGCTAGPGVFVGPLTSPLFGGVVQDSTDAQGRAAVQLQMGGNAGPASVVVRVPSIGLVDTVGFTVHPGAPARIVALPADSAVLAGASYPLRATVTDRVGNVRPEEATFGAANDRVSVNGGVLRALAVGRGLVTVRAASLVDTVRVSVVPPATIAVYRQSTSYLDTASVLLVNLDGSGLRRLAYANNQYLGAEPATAWNPAGTRLVFEDQTTQSGGPWRLYAADLSGAVSQLPANPAVVYELRPSFSPDGAWIYFSGAEVGPEYSFWRMRPDGTGLERITGSQTSYLHAPRVSLSPGGERFVYALGAQGRDFMRVYDLRTRSSAPLDVLGYGPRWSPNAELIAFTSARDGSVRLVRPDGSGERAVSPPGRRYRTGLEWSPDGRYLLARESGAELLELIEVATGVAMPLPFTRRMVGPAWKP